MLIELFQVVQQVVAASWALEVINNQSLPIDLKIGKTSFLSQLYVGLAFVGRALSSVIRSSVLAPPLHNQSPSSPKSCPSHPVSIKKLKIWPRPEKKSRTPLFKSLPRPGADPIKNFSIEFDSTLEYWLIREAKIGRLTDLIGQFQHRVKFLAGNLFIGSGPGLRWV